MDITKQNFLECLPEIRQTINKAAFFVIDGEFTGIASEYNISAFDTPERYFKKTMENSKDFILIQFGLTAFYTREDEPDKFYYRSYNFYVYPRSRRGNTFKCQGQSMAFLAENGFDFNKLFRDGITYSTMAEAEKLKEHMLERQQQRASLLNGNKNQESPKQNFIPVTEENKDWLEIVRKQIEAFLESDDSELALNSRNSFQRKLIYQLIDENFPDSVSKGFDKNKGGLVIERKRSPEEERKKEEERIQYERKEWEELVGISLVLKELSESKKLIVGHNMLLDVLYILKQCFGQIPADYKEFKKFTNEIFPNLIDTKYLCSLEKFKNDIHSSILADVYDTVSKGPFKIPDFECDSAEYSYSLTNRKEHNAGFDSFLTGICFLGLTNFFNIRPIDLNASSKTLHNKKNKLFCVRLQDVCFINLVGEEPHPSRDHVFHVTFPANWKQSDLINHFSNFGSIFVSWLGDTEAFVALQNRQNSGIVLTTIGFMQGVKVQSFAEYSKHVDSNVNESIKSTPSTPVTPVAVTKIKTPMSIVTIPISADKSLNKRKRKNSDTISAMHSTGSSSAAIKKTFKDSDIWE